MICIPSTIETHKDSSVTIKKMLPLFGHRESCFNGLQDILDIALFYKDDSVIDLFYGLR